MPIDVSVTESPGWWMKRLFEQLNDPRRRKRLQLLHDYYRGHAPLPAGAEVARSAFEGFQRKARTNYAAMIIAAASERMRIVGFRSAVDSDITGDAAVAALWRRAGMRVVQTQAHDKMLALGETFVIVGALDEETGAPVITAEDPRTMVAEEVPGNPNKILAALKILHDTALGEDRAYLYLPGQVWVAKRKRTWFDSPGVYTDRRWSSLTLSFDPQSWDWDDERSGELPHKRLPVVRFVNHEGMGEFETHTDVIDRINHQVLQRMVIATMQAWRQRAVKGLPDTYDDDNERAGEQIDYSEVFTSDPGSFWQLPDTADMWESTPVDLRGLLDAVKDDVIALASVTRTPLHMLQPGGDNQSAEGAASQREGLVFKVEDRMDLANDAWNRVMALALLHVGDAERADLFKLDAIWARAERLSLAEKADAASKAQNDMPRRTRLIKIWDLPPSEADEIMAEWADELLQQQLAIQTAAAAVNPAGAAPVPAADRSTQRPTPTPTEQPTGAVS